MLRVHLFKEWLFGFNAYFQRKRRIGGKSWAPTAGMHALFFNFHLWACFNAGTPLLSAFEIELGDKPSDSRENIFIYDF